ncbi:MAG: chloramphenicol phosphotransferase CPT family protein [Alphaproteobacteria bacterium]
MTIIFLNGAGSAGKSSIAKAIQELADEPYLTIGFDVFYNMMPWKYVGSGAKAKEGFSFVTSQDSEGKTVTRVNTGNFGAKVNNIIPKVIKTMADDNFNIIIDEILFGDDQLKLYMRLLQNHVVYFVGVKCSLEALEEREYLRGDRLTGLSREQVNKVHEGFRPYDLTVDTTHNSCFNCAKSILEFTKKIPNPKGFKSNV